MDGCASHFAKVQIRRETLSPWAFSCLLFMNHHMWSGGGAQVICHFIHGIVGGSIYGGSLDLGKKKQYDEIAVPVLTG